MGGNCSCVSPSCTMGKGGGVRGRSLDIAQFCMASRALGGSKTLRIPAWGGGNGSCLIDYVPVVHKMLEERVESITQSYVQRKEYVAAMLSIFGASVLEYNTENFKNIAFLFEYQGFSFITQGK